MFMGTFRHNVDAKGRLSIPAPFRDVINGRSDQSLILTSTLDGCLALYPIKEWTLFIEKAKTLPAMNKMVQKFHRFLFSRAMSCNLDKQGRVLISPSHRAFATLEGETCLVGVENKIEIWSPERWADMDADIAANPEDLQDAMAGMGM